MSVAIFIAAGLPAKVLSDIAPLTSVGSADLVSRIKSQADAKPRKDGPIAQTLWKRLAGNAAQPEAAKSLLSPMVGVWADASLDAIPDATEAFPECNWIILTCSAEASLLSAVEMGGARSPTAILEAWRGEHRAALALKKRFASRVFLVDVADSEDTLALIWRHLFGSNGPARPSRFSLAERAGDGVATSLVSMILNGAKDFAALDDEIAAAIAAQNEKLQDEELRKSQPEGAQSVAVPAGPGGDNVLSALREVKSLVSGMIQIADPAGGQLRAHATSSGLGEAAVGRTEAGKITFELNEIAIALAKMQSTHAELQQRNDVLCRQVIQLVQDQEADKVEAPGEPAPQEVQKAEEMPSLQHEQDALVIQNLGLHVGQIEEEVNALYGLIGKERDAHREEMGRLKKTIGRDRPLLGCSSVTLTGVQEGKSGNRITLRLADLNSPLLAMSAADFTLEDDENGNLDVSVKLNFLPSFGSTQAGTSQTVKISFPEKDPARGVSCDASTWLIVGRVVQIALDSIRRGDFLRAPSAGDLVLERWRKTARLVQTRWLELPDSLLFDRLTLTDYFAVPGYEHLEFVLDKVSAHGSLMEEFSFKMSAARIQKTGLLDPTIEIRRIEEGKPLLDAWALAKSDKFGKYLKVCFADSHGEYVPVGKLTADDANLFWGILALLRDAMPKLETQYRSKGGRPFKHWVDLLGKAPSSQAAADEKKPALPGISKDAEKKDDAAAKPNLNPVSPAKETESADKPLFSSESFQKGAV